MPVVHKLVTSKFQSQNRLGLQYYVECSCGFQGRLGTEQAAHSQFDAHLMYNNTEPYFSKLAEALAAKESPGSWKPVGSVEPNTVHNKEWRPVDSKEPTPVATHAVNKDWKPVGAR
jgi:hypothetical protein